MYAALPAQQCRYEGIPEERGALIRHIANSIATMAKNWGIISV
jgi:hypothetical protein